MDEFPKICETLVQMARLLLSGKPDEAVRYLQRKAFANRKSTLMVWMDLNKMFSAESAKLSGDGREFGRMDVGGMPLASKTMELMDGLLAKDIPPISLPVEPIYDADTYSALRMIVREQNEKSKIAMAGLEPSDTALFTGAPGVGKTLAAKWLANTLSLPLYTLNLAAVMSSFLGKTGNNIHQVFEFAAKTPCILLLDEFDAIAKRRNDDTEVGELKRLVTVLLQEIDSFAGDGLLIAATNHAELLDPAVSRRFEVKVQFPSPSVEATFSAIKAYMGSDYENAKGMEKSLMAVFRGKPFSDVKIGISQIRKLAIVNSEPVNESAATWLSSRIKAMNSHERKDFAVALIDSGFTQREAYGLSGVSRDTIRKELGRRRV